MTITIFLKSENLQIQNLPPSLEDLKNHIQISLQNKLPQTWDLYYLNSQGHNIPISDDIEYAKTLELEKDHQIPPGLNLFILPIKIEHHEEHKASFEKRDLPCTDEEFQARRDQGQEADLGVSMSMQSSISSVSSISVSHSLQNIKEEEKIEVRYAVPLKAPYEEKSEPRDPKAENLREYFADGERGLKDLKHRYKAIIKLAQRGNREAIYRCDELFFALPEGTVEVLKASLKVSFQEFQEDLKRQIQVVLPAENEGDMGFVAKSQKKVEGWVKLNQMKRDFRTKLREIKRNFKEIKREEKQKDKKLRKMERKGSMNNDNNQSNNMSESFVGKIQGASQKLMTSLSMKVKWSS